MIVVDLGCATYPQHPEDESTLALIERFAPSVYYGFDPHPSAIERDRWIGKTRTVIQQKAAWLYDGFVGYVMPPAVPNPLRAYTAEDAGSAAVACFDLCAFLRALPAGGTALKLDVEGAEYTLLPRLHEQQADKLLSLLLVEWHNEPLPIPFRCPVEVWDA